MNNGNKHDSGRRRMLARLGLLAGAGYVAPALLTLDVAHAHSRPSGRSRPSRYSRPSRHAYGGARRGHPSRPRSVRYRHRSDRRPEGGRIEVHLPLYYR